MRKNQGFTLIEMSIVLVIIGLLVVSVMIGRDLIHNADLQDMIQQLESYTAASNTFYTKYNSLPGDTAKATSYGLADAACPAGAGPTPPVVPGCNGDGDGMLTRFTDNAENINFWHHLSQANLVDGNFDGMTVTYGRGAPRTKLKNVGIYRATPPIIFPMRNIFIVGVDEQVDSIHHLVPMDAWHIDNKLDDGLPDAGIVQAPYSFDPLCYTTPPLSEYNTLNPDQVCALFVRK